MNDGQILIYVFLSWQYHWLHWDNSFRILSNKNETLVCGVIRWSLIHGSVINHYNDVIMSTMASQITSLTIVYSMFYLSADERKQQSSATLAFVRGIHRRPVNSPHKGPITRKMFPFDDVIMLPVWPPSVEWPEYWWRSLGPLAQSPPESRDTGRGLLGLHKTQRWHLEHSIKWKHFPRYWPFVRRIHRSPVNSPHKRQWRGALMFTLICVWINGGKTIVKLVIWDAIAPIMTS